MIRCFCSLLIFCCLYQNSFSQQNIAIEEVIVSASRVNLKASEVSKSIRIINKAEIKNAPVSSVNELLKYVANIDVRQRSLNGIQADVGIRGSNSSQVLILLNGVRMNDPQTSHYNMNLPVELLDIERIEILYGGASRIYGEGAFAGAINIITKNLTHNNVKANVGLGQYGWNQIGTQLNLGNKKISHSLSVLKKEAEGEYSNTDFKASNLFWQSEFHGKNGGVKINLGQNKKEYGAHNFYSARYPDQFDANKLQFASAVAQYQIKKLKLSATISKRLHYDRFELFREGNGYYAQNTNGTYRNIKTNDTIPWYTGPNYHKTNVSEIGFNTSYQSKIGISSLGYNFRNEYIQSNALGQTMTEKVEVKEAIHPSFYTKSDRRENHSLYFEHNIYLKKIFVSAGALYNINNHFGNGFYPGIDIGYQLNTNLRAFGSVNKSFRFPSFTDLYYNLGGAIGSNQLKQEESINYELGLNYSNKSFTAKAVVFARDGKNLIDWVSFNGIDTIKAANLTKALFKGIETNLFYDFSAAIGENSILQSIRLNVSILSSDTSSKGFESNYVLDYLKTQANLNLNFQFFKNSTFSWRMHYQDRTGEYYTASGEKIPYGQQILSDARLSYQFGAFNCYVQVSNLFDVAYVDIGNIQLPGRMIAAGLQFDLSFPSFNKKIEK